jgi:trimethylamine--corrinoid protein Co-methyltransferase
MAKRIGRGIEINSETIMLDLLEKVGPGGNFLAEPESARLCRQEIWVPTLGDRNAYQIWERKGCLTMEERIHARLISLLNSHLPPALPEGAEARITEILAAGELRQGLKLN